MLRRPNGPLSLPLGLVACVSVWLALAPATLCKGEEPLSAEEHGVAETHVLAAEGTPAERHMLEQARVPLVEDGGQGWLHGDTPGWTVVSEGPDHFEAYLEVPPPTLVPSRLGDREASRLELAGWVASSPEGAPLLPMKSLALAVPEGEQFEITVEGEEPVTFSDVLLIPFSGKLFTHPKPESLPARAASDAHYSSDAFWPAAIYRVGAPSYLRDLRLVPVDVRPARYNAARRELQLFKRLKIRLETWGGTEDRPLVRGRGGRLGRGEEMWDEIYREIAVNYPSDIASRAIRSRSPLRRAGAGDYFDSSDRWLALEVRSRGMHKITYENILDAGVPKAELEALDPATVRLFNGGGLPIDIEQSLTESPSWMTECAVLLEDGDDGGFDPGDMVIFYGLGASGWSDHRDGNQSWGEYFENVHTDYNVYWLTWGGDFESGPPLRMGSRDGQPGTGAFTPETYRARVHREVNSIWRPAPFEEGYRWERWWWQELAMADRAGRRYTLDLKDVDTSADCRLRARFWGDEFVWGCLPHHVIDLNFNGSPDFTVRAQMYDRMDVDTTAVWAVEGTNVFIAEVRYMKDTCLKPPKYRIDECFFAWFELEYYRRFVAVNDELRFDWIEETHGPVAFEANGFDSDAIRVFDVTDRFGPISISTSAISQGTITFQEDFDGARKDYYLVTDAALRAPARILVRSPGALRARTAPVDYIIVTGAELIDAAQVLADWRRSHLFGITDLGEEAAVEIADVSDIYDEFSWGILDPLAIRNFLEFRFRTPPPGKRPPSYALMLGEATWDFKDVYERGVVNIVPSYDEGYDWRSRTQYTSDDFFVLFDGPEDRFAEMAIGRLTPETSAEAMDIITQKIIGFERDADPGPWRNTVVLAADDACSQRGWEGLGYRHTDQVDDLSKYYLPEALDRTRVYMIDYGGPVCPVANKPEARRDFIKALDSGAILINYVGHGSENVLADEHLFFEDDVAILDNEGRIGFFVTASCAVGKFDVPLEIGVSEGMSRHPSKGALATYSATTLAYIPPNRELDERLVHALLPKTSPDDPVRVAPTKPLGLAVLQAEGAFENWDYFTPYKYVLLGDPASVLPAPGTPYPSGGPWLWVDLSLNRPGLGGGERDTLRGAVMADNGGVATSFQGRVNVLVHGVRISKQLPSFKPYTVPGPTFFRGETQVVDGRFEISWLNPYEVKTGGGGRIRAFVWNDDADAVGALTALEITPPMGPREDLKGPDIELSFETPGDAVTPGAGLVIKVSDPSGVNLAPILSENALFVRLHNEDLNRLMDGPVDLAEGFIYEEGSSSSGKVTYRLPTGLPVEEGVNTYRIEVNASDNFSNRSRAEVTFNLFSESVLRLTDVINYPNPFWESTTIGFRVMKEADVVVKVYTVGGRLVRTFRAPAVNGRTTVVWDGKDSEGEDVANGVYLYKVTAVSTGAAGEKANAIGKATVIR